MTDSSLIPPAGIGFSQHPFMPTSERDEAKPSGFATLTLTVDRARLEAHFCQLAQAPLRKPVRLLPPLDVATGVKVGLRRLIEFFAKELDQPPGLHAAPLVQASLSEPLLATLLTCVQHDQSYPLNAPRPRIRPSYVRRAEAYIDAHADEPISMVDVANAAGVSLRALQRAFMRCRGSSPKDFLKERRLDLVRSRLLAAEANTTVTSAATSAGYSHVGRFAADYKRRFGESPSATLRHRRSSRCSP